jgi:hypothetical protein
LRCQNVLREDKAAAAAAAAAAAIEPEAEEYLHEDLLDGEGEGFWDTDMLERLERGA